MSPGQDPKWQAAGVSPVVQSLFSTLSSPVHTSSRARHVYTDLRFYTALSLASTGFIPTWPEGPALCQAPCLEVTHYAWGWRRILWFKVHCLYMSVDRRNPVERAIVLYISDLRLISFDFSLVLFPRGSYFICKSPRIHLFLRESL